MSGPVQSDKVWLEDEGVAKQVVMDEVLYARGKKKDVPTMTMDEVVASNKNDLSRVLLVIKGKVYNVKHFAKTHPGGTGPLFHGAGKDMTDAFQQFHSLETWKRLNVFHVANVAQADLLVRNEHALQKDWDSFAQQVLSEGLYQTNYWYFVGEAARCFCVLLASLAFTLGYAGDATSMRMVGACLLGIWWQQTAFLGHDAGHNGITHNRKLDDMIGICAGNLAGGLGIGWWKKSHNNHHIACNSIDGDADIQHMPFLACNPIIVDKPFWSSYHNKLFNATEPLTRFLLCYQHILYYPIIFCFSRYNLYIQTWIHVLSGKSHMPRTEVVTLVIFFSWTAALVASMPSVSEMVLYVFLSHFVAGILSIQITLSHFAMDVYYGSAYSHKKGIEDGWLFTQLRTTLAIDNPPWMDWFHGGLQFQDVHHLLPRVPRHNLRQLRPRVQALCRKHGIDISPQVTFTEANIMVMKLLVQTAKKVSSMTYLTPADVGNSPLWETLNAQG